MGGKRGVKEYWEELMKDHARLVEDAEEQVEEFKVAMVSRRERERERENDCVIAIVFLLLEFSCY